MTETRVGTTIREYASMPASVWWQVLAVFFVVLAIALAAMAARRGAATAELQRNATQLAASYAHNVEERLEHGLSATYANAVMVRAGDGDFPQFESVAAQMLLVYRGIAALQLAPQGVIRRVVPLAGNEAVVGHDLFKDPRRNKEALLARDTGKLTLAGPFKLIQGGYGMVGRLPIYVDDASGKARFWGFSSVLIRVEGFLKAVEIDGLVAQGYAYQLSRLHPDSGGRDVFASSRAAMNDPVHFDFTVPNGNWRLSLAPVAGWYPPRLRAFEYGAAFLIGLFAAAFAAYRLRQPYVLQQRVDARTRDLSETNAALQLAEARVRQGAERLRLVLTRTPIVLYLIDRKGRVLLAEGKGLEVLGLTSGDVVGDDVQFLFGTAPSALAHIERALAGESFSAVVEVGSAVFENWYSPVFDAGGQVSGVTGVAMDISGRARAEREQRKLARAIEQSPVSIVITDRGGRIEYVNPKFSQVTGYRPDEVIGGTPRILKSGDMLPVEYERLWQTITAGNEWRGLLHNRKKDGELIWENVTISPITDSTGAISHFVAVKEDVTDRKAIEDRMEFMAHHDALTGLPNRVLLHDRFDRALTQVERTGGEVAVCFLDLDRFKTINDTLGHEVGDLLLQEVARRLRACVRETDTVSRLGGDEFVLVLNGVRNAHVVQDVAEKIQERLLAPIDVAGHALTVTFSLGASLYPDDGADFETLLKHADTAMYHAKESGRNTYRFFAEQMNVDALERLHVTQDLRHAIEADELRLFYQPQIDLADGRIVGVEALIRWQHPQRGLVLPIRFIPAAEESGLIVPIGNWVLREACRQGRAWRDAGLPPLTIAVNVSAIQFRRGDLEREVAGALAATGFDATHLELEITESALIEHPEKVQAALIRLKEIGVSLAIDDFGTGYSSLSYLKRFHVDKLKIDRSFIRDIETDPDDASIVTAMIQMAKSLKLRTIAEGVEQEGMIAHLRSAGCDEAQGYHFGHPEPPAEVIRRLEAQPAASRAAP